MSRIGKKIINIPSDVQIILANKSIQVIGKYGTLEKQIFDHLKIQQEEKHLSITCISTERKAHALHGLMRALIQNMILGVNQQFSKTLLVEGVGYKFLLRLEDRTISLNMGFTNPINFKIPTNLNVTLESPTRMLITGIDIEAVGLFSAKIRSVRPPEPYKGKGIRYLNEIIRRKVGKTRK